MTKIKKGFIFLLIAAAVAAAVLAASTSLSGSKQTGSRAAAVYYCPMHPTYISDRPGDCPICNMKLVKKETPEESPKKDASAEPQDVCVMHSCPMMKPGEKCPMMVVAKEGEEVTCPVCGTHVVGEDGSLKKILYWTDPMMPGYRSDKPGKSPMGMDLLPVYEEKGASAVSKETAPSGYVPILVTAQKRQFIGVRTAKAERRAIKKVLRTVGRIAYDPELYQAQQEYLSSIRAWKEAQNSGATGAAESSKRIVESSQMRLKILGLNKELIEEVGASEAPDKSLLLTDPSGKAWLYAPVYEYELPLVKVGQTVEVEISAQLGKKLIGTVRAIDTVLDPLTRTAKVRAVLTDAEGNLKPEMYVNVSIAVQAGEVLSVPEEAVFNTGTKQIVFVDKASGIFEPRDVKTGFKAEGYYEVKEGVSEGEDVVTSGNFLIDSESRLKAALEGMGAGDGAHQHGQ